MSEEKQSSGGCGCGCGCGCSGKGKKTAEEKRTGELGVPANGRPELGVRQSEK